MTTSTTLSGVTYITDIDDDAPTDVPVWNPNRLFKIWAISEIYTGSAGIGTGNIGRFVPNVDDLIFDQTVGYYIVYEVDNSSLIASWKVYTEPTTVDTGVDQWLNVGPRSPQEGYFLYVDSTVSPPIMAFDSMLLIYSKTANYIRVFSTTSTAASTSTSSLEVLSAMYDSTGTYTNDKIPLEDVTNDTTGNYKVPVTGYSKRAITEGETVLIIAYDTNGLPTSRITMTAIDSGIIRQSNTGYREIIKVELLSSYLSTTDALRLLLPVNVIIDSVDVMCRVTYNDGSTRTKPIDGSKISISGLNEFVATQEGQISPLTLFYQLDSTESYQGTTTVSNTIAVAYNIETTSLSNAYSVKLFSYPEWQSANAGYYLRHFLYESSRLEMWEVTSLVEASTGSAVWDPKLYNTKQYMKFAIDLSQVSDAFVDYHHVQSTVFTLMTAGTTDDETPWYVNFNTGSEDYGDGVECKLTYVSSQVWTVDITSGAATQAEWLAKLYNLTFPLYDTATESAPPTPTHFVVQVDNIRVRQPIANWNATYTISTGGTVGELALIQWIYEENGTDLQLAASGAIIRQVISN